MHLTKHHGLGNDFLVALSRSNPELTADPDRARALCDRHRGVGADGLMWGLTPLASGSDLRMVLHNSDGSEAEISGNGIRCLAQAHLRSVGAESGDIVIETAAGLRIVTCEATDDPDRIDAIVDMGAVTDGPTIPDAVATDLASRYGGHVATASVGNPHLVVEVTDLDEIAIDVVGPHLEQSFPGGINVHFFAVTGPDRLTVTHWERGAGVTLACGSGAVATATLASRWGLVGDTTSLDLPGGAATVTVGASALLRGPAQFVAEVIVP